LAQRYYYLIEKLIADAGICLGIFQNSGRYIKKNTG